MTSRRLFWGPAGWCFCGVLACAGHTSEPGALEEPAASASSANDASGLTPPASSTGGPGTLAPPPSGSAGSGAAPPGSVTMSPPVNPATPEGSSATNSSTAETTASETSDETRTETPSGDTGDDPTATPSAEDSADTTASSETTSSETDTDTTAGPVSCVAPSPPAEFTQTLELTWQEMMGQFEGKTGARPVSAGMQQFTNTILDQVMGAGGSLRYCVRWDNPRAATPQLRDEIAEALERHVNRWFQALVGYDCWPFEHIPVTVTAWAVRPEHRENLQWSDAESPVRIDTGHIREDAPECLQACNRFFNRQPGFDYPECPGGFEAHFDLSLWLTEDFGPAAGVGGDWGQRMSPPMFIDNMQGDHPGVWLHEFGHGFGFPDYYNWQTWVGDVEPPPSVMVAGRPYSEWDDWMLRQTWSEIRQFRYLDVTEHH